MFQLHLCKKNVLQVTKAFLQFIQNVFCSSAIFGQFCGMFTHRPILETDRLRIMPLSHNQLINYLQADGSLEVELGVEPLKREISLELIEAFEKIILPTVGNPSCNYLFSTLWTLIDKEKMIMVGDICFKGDANPDGEVEIGYGTYPPFQKQGYMTEAVEALCQWAFTQTKVSGILADTHSTNIASQKILLKNGFKPFSESENKIYWRLQKVECLEVERA